MLPPMTRRVKPVIGAIAGVGAGYKQEKQDNQEEQEDQEMKRSSRIIRSSTGA